MFHRLFNEAVPHVGFCVAERRIESNRRRDLERTPTPWAAYVDLPEEQLDERLVEEGNRAAEIDSKTVRAVASIAVGFTFLGVSGPLIIEAIDSPVTELIVVLVGLLAVLYLLDASFLLFGAMRTVERYGFGTQYRINVHRKMGEARLTYIAKNLWAQEMMNTRRHNRNSTVFATLRNVLLLVTLATVLTAVTILVEYFSGSLGETAWRGMMWKEILVYMTPLGLLLDIIGF